MQIPESKPLRDRWARGLTMVELIVATAILLVLSGMAVPMARVTAHHLEVGKRATNTGSCLMGTFNVG